MARPRKQIIAEVLPPQDPKNVKHGCVDCAYRELDTKSYPCRDCNRWSHWKDKAFVSA